MILDEVLDIKSEYKTTMLRIEAGTYADMAKIVWMPIVVACISFVSII